MAKPRIIPSDRELQRLVNKGFTHQEIADIISEESGTPIARSTVSAALSRAGMTERIRYDEIIPWSPIKVEHNYHYALTMLRLLARRNEGDELDDEKNARLDSWIEKLTNNNAVVVYVPDSAVGFHYVERKPSDGKSFTSLRVPSTGTKARKG